ncbi:hypothetical protein [Bacillus suaedaesalsae]|uniref:Uncharacterized protein n=1 Tax=Bacillus suaedaesalsae TaxID=2810349 RepID=A0ABS2DHF7_9BACI|nr:hypothetical protein [Bacillus suaedaesalsae]MBM6617916.1 hypothetical protein [Bacillus suaedaesalsae]
MRTLSQNITKVQALVFGLNFLLYSLAIPIDYKPLSLVVAISTIATIFLTIPFMRGLSFYLSVLFVVSGVAMQVLVHTDLTEFILSFSDLSSIAAFIGIIPILAIPISLIRTRESNQSLEKMPQLSGSKLYTKGSTMSFSLASIMNMGALPLTWSYLNTSYKLEKGEEVTQTLSTSITRGFALAMIWSPIGAGVAIVAELTKSSVITLIPFTFLAAIGGLMLDRLLHKLQTRNRVVEREEQGETKKLNIISLAIPLLIFMCLTIMLDLLLPYGMLYILTVATLPFTFVWVIIIRELQPFNQSVKRHFKQVIPSMYSQIGILLSAGFFVKSLKHDTYIQPVYQFFTVIKDQVGTGPLLIIGMASLILLSIVGVHQFVSITIVALVINPIDLAISPIIYGVGMLTALCIGIMISPFNGTTAMMSSLTKKETFTVAKWNAKFTAILFAVVSTFLLGLLAVF